MFEVDYSAVKLRKKTLRIVFIVGLIIILIMGGILIFNINKENSMTEEIATGNITAKTFYDDDGKLRYRATYHYSIDGKDYECVSRSTSYDKPPMEGIVRYEKGNPANCVIDSDNYVFLIAIALIIVTSFFVILYIISRITLRIETKKLDHLAHYGILVRGLPYSLIPTDIKRKGIKAQQIHVYYTLPNGTVRAFKSAPRIDYVNNDSKTADLLYDNNNLNNYYIDYEIKYSRGTEYK